MRPDNETEKDKQAHSFCGKSLQERKSTFYHLPRQQEYRIFHPRSLLYKTRQTGHSLR